MKRPARCGTLHAGDSDERGGDATSPARSMVQRTKSLAPHENDLRYLELREQRIWRKDGA